MRAPLKGVAKDSFSHVQHALLCAPSPKLWRFALRSCYGKAKQAHEAATVLCEAIRTTKREDDARAIEHATPNIK